MGLRRDESTKPRRVEIGPSSRQPLYLRSVCPSRLVTRLKNAQTETDPRAGAQPNLQRKLRQRLEG